jgi:hypothetical protein
MGVTLRVAQQMVAARPNAPSCYAPPIVAIGSDLPRRTRAGAGGIDTPRLMKHGRDCCRRVSLEGMERDVRLLEYR